MRPCQTTPPPAKTITFEHKCGNIYVQYILRPKLHSTELTQNSDFSNERLRKRGRSPAAAYPFSRGRTVAAPKCNGSTDVSEGRPEVHVFQMRWNEAAGGPAA